MHRWSKFAVGAALTVIIGGIPWLTEVASAEDSPLAAGADGVGDPYYPQDGNGGYRVFHYDVTVTVDPARQDQFAGTTLVRARATQELDRFDLDLKGFLVTAVTVDGEAARAITRAGDHELVITAAHRIHRGAPMDVEVRYQGMPNSEGWHQLPSGGVSASGEPHGATSWYPANDHPSDKATFSLTATVPDGWTVIGNGLPGPATHTTGHTTFRWSEQHPMATYLSTMAIDKFTVVRSALPDGTPVINAYGAGAQPTAETNGLPAQMVKFLSARFGPYPFESTGSLVLPGGPESGLETQSRPTYDDGPYDVSAVHELAHPWFGDSVSFADWRDGCIAECFAQYADLLLDAGDDIDQEYRDTVSANGQNAQFWSVPLYDPGRDQPLAGALYDRGPLMLPALRRTVGETTFWGLLRGWLHRYRDANASWPDFEKLAQKLSGRDLRGFFQAWAHGTTVPADEYLYPGSLRSP